MNVKFIRLKDAVGSLKKFDVYVNGSKEISLSNGESKSIEVSKGSLVVIKGGKFITESQFKLYDDEDVMVIIEIRNALVSKRGLTSIIIKEGSLVKIVR